MHKKLLELGEGDSVKINGLLLKINRVDSEVDDKYEYSGKIYFLSDGKDDFKLWVPIEEEKLQLEKIKIKGISRPWKYTILKTISVEKIEFL